MQIINSNQNKLYKHFKSLSQKKNRYKSKQFLLEGDRVLKYAVENHFKIDYVVIDEQYIEKPFQSLALLPSDLKPLAFSSTLFKEVTETEQSQGIFGVVEMPDALTMDELMEMSDFSPTASQVVYLDRLQDPGNLGTIIRTADACGIKYILMNKGTVDPYNAKVIRSTAGSILNVCFVLVDEDSEALRLLSEAGMTLLVTSLDAEYTFTDRKAYGEGNCLVIGNEANGVSDEIQSMDCHRIIIPIIGKAESLNASVAAGIMMYKLVEYCIQKS